MKTLKIVAAVLCFVVIAGILSTANLPIAYALLPAVIAYAIV